MTKNITQQSSPNLIGQTSPEFDLNGFEAAVWQKGYDVVVEQAFMCPCATYNNSPKTDCKNCLGIGWVFIDPLQTKAIMHSINTDTKFKSWSKELLGTYSISLMHKDRISYMNRVTLINNSLVENKSIFSDIVKVRSVSSNPFVFLAYRPTDILGVYAFNGSGNPLAKLSASNYSISEDNGYVLNVDFDFSTISNFNGHLSVLYKHELQYHIIDIPHDVRNSYIKNNDGREEQIRLPVNAYARKAHNVVEIANRDGSGVIDNSDGQTVTADSITIKADSINVSASGGTI